LTDEVGFHDAARSILLEAFENGITHFDFANNYDPPAGAAEERCGRILSDLPREELVISSKAGWPMWPGPYGDGGSRKYLVQSCDQSLRRLQVDHLDIFYHHRPDPQTPLEETLKALDFIVRSGRALYVGISSYPGDLTRQALRNCEARNLIRPIIHQPKYNMFERRIEEDLVPVASQAGLGVIVFSPLAQGLLTRKYLNGIPANSRAANPDGVLKAEQVESRLGVVRSLNHVAEERGQSLAQLAVTWVLRSPRVTSAIIGASRPEQVAELAAAFDSPQLSQPELQSIDQILCPESCLV